MSQSITLNVPVELSPQDWEKVAAVFRELDGWMESNEACWYGHENDKKYITASAEPGGLLLEGEIDGGLWTGWISVLCAKLTLALGREIHDAEM